MIDLKSILNKNRYYFLQSQMTCDTCPQARRKVVMIRLLFVFLSLARILGGTTIETEIMSGLSKTDALLEVNSCKSQKITTMTFLSVSANPLKTVGGAGTYTKMAHWQVNIMRQYLLWG